MKPGEREGGSALSDAVRRPMTRRRMLALSGITLSGIVLASCSGGSLVHSNGGGGGGGLIFDGVERLVVNPRQGQVTNDRGVPTSFLGYVAAKSGALTSFWGTQDASAVPTRLTQALYWDGDPAQGTRVLYDGQGLPTRIEHEANGAFVLAFWEADRATFKFYQPDGSYIGGAAVTGSGQNFTATQLPDSNVVGYYSGTLNGLTDAIVTFTVGGTATAAAARGVKSSGRRATTREETDAAAQEAQVKAAVAALSSSATDTQSQFASDLLAAIGEPLRGSNLSPLGNQILSAALSNTGLSPVFLDNGLPILEGLAAAYRLRAAAGDAQQQITATGAVPASVGVLYQEPDPVVYRAANAFGTTRPDTDDTGVRGIVASREYDTVSMVGYIQSSGAVFLSGTAKDGTVIELRGTVQNGHVPDGTWQLKTVGGAAPASFKGRQADDNGTWDADETPLGACQQQANSGGQGIFSNTYDLGKCGTFPFTYQAYTIPDQFQIFQDDLLIFDTCGKVSGGASVSVAAVGQTTIVRVVVTADESGTVWDYTLGCPE